MHLDKVTVFCFFASYAVALLCEVTQFARRSQLLRWAAVGFTGAGLLAHTIYLVVRSRHTELPPLLASAHDWQLVSAWLAVVLYLGIQVWNRDLSLGVFCLPVVLLLIAVSQFVSTHPSPLLEMIDQPREGQLYWGGLIHAAFWAVGILGVILAIMVSLMYLVQHARLKHKQAELPALHLFSLERLGKLNWWLIILSVPLLTLGMGTGIWMSYLSQSRAHPVNLVSLAFVANAAIWSGMAVLFGWLLAAKNPTGRIVATRTLWACLFLLATLVVIKMLSMDTIHSGADPGVRRSAT